MSLFGALSLGGSSLAAQQTGLQVTGNNIANAGTDGYTRQVVNLTPGDPQQVAPGQFLGTGVAVSSIQRQANDSINQSLRNATSAQTGAQTLDTLLGGIQSTFGALGDNDLSGQMTNFFNSFSTLANNPGSDAQRSIVVENGASLADDLQSLRGQLVSIRTDAQSQVGTLASQANSLAQSIAALNKQITVTQAGGGVANTLLDQRDQNLTQLAQIMDIHVINQSDGTVNVLVGSQPLVQGTTSRGVTSTQSSDPTGEFSVTQVNFADTGDPMAVTGGQLGSIISARDNYLTPAIQTVDTMAAGLINAVNAIHTQGQGLSGFSTVTSTTAVQDPTAALNGPQSTTGITFPPQNGTFNLYLQDATTGQITTKQITVNLSGQGAPTTLNALAAQLTAAGGGVVTAAVNPNGTLTMASNNSNVTFGFGEDTSGTLASLGINTFFTGTNATNIAVNSVVANDPSMLAAGRGNVAGSNANAQALSLAGSAAVSQLGGKSLTDYYSNYIGDLAVHAQNASDNVTAQSAIHDTIYAQQQAISGVSMDEEAINLTKYQRAFEGSARFITVIDQMMQDVLALVQ